MKKNTQTPHFSIHIPQVWIFLTGALFIALGFVFSCDTTNNSKEPEISGIEVTPVDHRIQRGDVKDFNSFVQFTSGEKKPFSELNPEKWDWLWITTEPEIATFQKNGVASGHSTGNTTCFVILGEQQATSLKSMFKDALLNKPAAALALDRAAASRQTLILRMLSVIPIVWDSFGIQVVQPAKLRAKHNLKKVPSQF